jgi:hypothetical protein
MRRWSVLALLVVVSCSEALGFDEVSFDRDRARATGGAANGGGPGAGAVDLTTADGSKTPFPNIWDAQAPGAPDAASNPPDAGAVNPANPPAFDLSTAAGVCNAWQTGHAVANDSPWTAGSSQCDPGTLPQSSFDETLARIAMYRHFVGLAPVIEAPNSRAEFMACAAVASWNPPGSGNPHAPAPTATCYTPQGADGAGNSNIAWGGRVPADGIDQYAEDFGNETTFGHRRWLLNPSLGAVGIGFYAGGGPYGAAQCLGIHDFSGTGPSPDWIAMPPPGMSPLTMASWTWTFHHKSGAATAMTVTRVSDGANMPMTTLPLDPGYGQYGVTAFQKQGWTASAGETYSVQVVGVTSSPITYEVKPIQCP